MTLGDMLRGYTAAGGSLSGDDLERFGREAWTLMGAESLGRIPKTEDGTPEADLIQQCFNALTDTAAAQSDSPILSETLGQWKRTYRAPGRSRNRQMVTVLRQYLGETGLLYRGWPG